ncbi:MAG: patatin-like phospholipase family protein [Sphingomonadales bacterium]|nr:patatin-like phospholipase family protein [Sphingomonadales bacterium]
MSTGLVLSGGAAKGYAHLGVLQAFYERNWHFDCIAGTSIGAIIGALLAEGHAPAGIKSIFDREKSINLLRFSRQTAGLLSQSGLRRALARHLKASRFEDLGLPLFVSTTDLNSGKNQVFNSGELIPALLASSAIPLLFEPVNLGNRLYIDGGITCNLPAHLIRPRCSRLVGVNVNPVHESGVTDSWLQSLERVLNIAIQSNIEPEIGLCDVYIVPEGMQEFHLFSLGMGDRMYEAGYQSAARHLDQLPTKPF